MSCYTSSPNSPSNKAKQLRALSALSPDGLIHFNSTGYTYFIEDTHRSYDVLLFFSTDGCTLCDELQQEYTLVHQMYTDNGG